MARSQSDPPEPLPEVPANRDRHHRLKSWLQILAGLGCFGWGCAWGAHWDVVSSVSVGEVYTDNVSLDPDTLKRGDWVTQLIPAVSIAATGTGLKFQAAYHPELNFYARGGKDNEVFQRGIATGTATLAEDLFFVDVGGQVDQYDASLQGPLTTSNINATGNRTSVTTLFASPYLRRGIGSSLRGEARFTKSAVHSDDKSEPGGGTSSLSDSTADRFDLHLKSGPAYRLVSGAVDFRHETIDYKEGEDTTSDILSASGKRLVTTTLGVLAQIGYEHYDAGAARATSEGPSWSIGLEWTPSPRMRLSGFAGHRFYGDTYGLDLSLRTRLTAWSATYAETITTSRSEFFVAPTSSTSTYLDSLFASQFIDPASRQRAVEEFVSRTGLPPSLNAPVNFFSNELFLVRRWQASAGVLGSRNIVIANLFREDSEVVAGGQTGAGAGDFASSNTVLQTGGSVLWNLRMTTRDAWNVGASYSHNEFPDIGRSDKLSYLGTGVTRQLQPRLYGSVNYRRQQNNSSDAAFSYTENAVFATLRKRF